MGILCVGSGVDCVRSIPKEFVDSSSAKLEERRKMGCLAHGRIPVKPFGLPGRMDSWFQLEAGRKNEAYVAVQVLRPSLDERPEVEGEVGRSEEG